MQFKACPLYPWRRPNSSSSSLEDCHKYPSYQSPSNDVSLQVHYVASTPDIAKLIQNEVSRKGGAKTVNRNAA